MKSAAIPLLATAVHGGAFKIALGSVPRELLRTGLPPTVAGVETTMTVNGKERGRQLLARICERMEVVDSDGTRIGTVARIEGGHFKILRNDQEPRNAHQFVRPELILSVDERVHLDRSWDELRRLWVDDEFNKHHNLQPGI